MKIIHLCTWRQGGAAIAVRRIVAAERKVGIDARLMTAEDFGIDPELNGFSPRILRMRLARKGEYILGKFQRTTNPIMHSLGLRSFGLVDAINALDADILHLHWINDGLLSIADVARLRKPLVWTLHDSWPFCGAEHHPNIMEDDNRYREGYSKDNLPISSSGLDLNRLVWNRKMCLWKNLNCLFTAPSTWEAELFNASALFRGCICRVVPNCVSASTFCPGDKADSRCRLGFEPSRKVVAFGACLQDDPNKGADFLAAALARLRMRRSDFEVLTFGRLECTLPLQAKSLGVIQDECMMADVYRAADVFVCPSRVENLPNTCVESLLCGTPAVAYNASGVVDVIDHKTTGYLAKAFEIDDLASGIDYCLEHHQEMSPMCRRISKDRFSEDRVAQQFKKLYAEIA